MKQKQRYKLKILQAYAPTSSYDAVGVDSFFEEVELAMGKVKGIVDDSDGSPKQTQE